MSTRKPKSVFAEAIGAWGPCVWGGAVGLSLGALMIIGFERNPPQWPYYIIVVPAGHTVTVK